MAAGVLSEHASAIGLAAIEQWPERRRQFLERAEWYHRFLGNVVRFQPEFGAFASATCVVWTEPVDAVTLAAALDDRGVETLRWWEAACPDHDAFRDAVSTPIPVSRNAADHTLGLPMHVTLTMDDVRHVSDAVAEAIDGADLAAATGGPRVQRTKRTPLPE